MFHLANLKHPTQAKKRKRKKALGRGAGQTGKKRREEKHDGAIGLQVLYFPEHDQAK